MISHQHKCIFIHISKCAGSSVEKAFGVNISNNTESNNVNLFGWNFEHNIFLQHATPQELIDFGFINKSIWDNYYKFIIIRNPFDRSLSDYIWLMEEISQKDTYINFLNRRGRFKEALTNNQTINYRGDHLKKQKEYFYINGSLIKYDRILRFENIGNELNSLTNDLNLSPNFFDKKFNVSKKKVIHYSKFYNQKRINEFEKLFKDDLNFLNYTFEDKKNVFDYFKLRKPSYSII